MDGHRQDVRQVAPPRWRHFHFHATKTEPATKTWLKVLPKPNYLRQIYKTKVGGGASVWAGGGVGGGDAFEIHNNIQKKAGLSELVGAQC